MPCADRGDRRPDDVRHSTRTPLTRAGFALYPAHLEGVDEAKLHAVFGTPDTDVAITPRQIALIREALTAAWRARQGRRAPGAPEAGQHTAGRTRARGRYRYARGVP